MANIIVKLNNAKDIPNLEERPHIKVDDLVLTYHLFVGEDKDRVATTPIMYNTMRLFNVTEDDLKDALTESQKTMPEHIQGLTEVVMEMTGMEPSPEEKEKDKVVVVTNTRRLNGASALFYPGVMEKMAKRFGGNYYVLPSSIHEVLCVKDDGVDVNELRKMVKEVNETQVAPEERLSDNVYYYNAETKVFGIAR